MTARRRGVLLAGLSLLLGGLAASDVARREAALASRLSPTVPVVVTREALRAGRRLAGGDLAVRRIPLRFAPPGVAADPAEVLGARLTAPVPAGSFLVAAHLADEAGTSFGIPVRRGERALEIVAAGSPETIRPGARVDVLVTRDDGGRGSTVLALQDVEVMAAGGRPPGAEAQGGSRVAATLRVTVRQAVFLTAAQSFAREIRLLPRMPGDRRRAGALRIGDDLR